MEEHSSLGNSLSEREEPPGSNWKWQIQNSITTQEQLEKYIELTKDEKDFFKSKEINKHIKFKITPYYLNIIKQNQELRKCVIPQIYGLIKNEHEEEDSLHEENDSPVPNLVHRYPDRALLLCSTECVVNCQYCTRSRIISTNKDLNLEEAFNYIENTKSLRDIIVSGGDPLFLNNKKIENILERLNSIEHIEMIRIGSKIPVTLPYRLYDKELLNILSKYSDKLWMNIHVTHPAEITDEMKKVCLQLNKIGITLGSQTVLLKNVNDNVDTMKELMQKLLTCKIRPYIIYMCDPVVGTKYFQSTIEKGLEIIKSLRGWTSGLAIPSFIIDSPSGGGKIPLLPNYIVSENDEKIVLKNYKGKEYTYYK